MDRRQLIVQRARDFFGDRLDDVREMVRQDRQELRGWQEPAHMRGALRRAGREEGAAIGHTRVAERTILVDPSPAETEFGEPERGQQREATAHLLDASLYGLEKVSRGLGAELTAEEAIGLECVLLLYGRPALAVANGSLASVPPMWNVLEDVREDIESAQRGVGRVELLGHPEFDWAGTAFLVGDGVLMTTRRVAETFIEQRNGFWGFRPGITAWMNYRAGYQDVSNAGYRVRGVLGVHDRYDLALLEVERPQVNGSSPVPLAIAARPPEQREGRGVYLVGYPVRDARRNEPEAVARVFRDVYNVKRVQPGQLRGELTFHDLTFLRHDAAPLGQNGGAPLIDLETHQVIGMQSTGRYLDANTAVPLYQLRDDPLLRACGVNFAEGPPRDRSGVVAQVERLARSRHWNEARSLIGNLYQRAFGNQPQDRP